MNFRPKAKGFTLIELLVVISIIALLSSVVMASLNAARSKAAIAAGKRFAASTHNVMGDQAVGVWDFNECSGASAVDRSGTGNTGTLLGGASMSSSTNVWDTGCSLALDGVDDYVSVSSNEILDSEGAVFAWAYPTAVGANRYVFQGNSDAGTNRLYIQWSGGDFIAVRSNPGISVTIKASAALNAWHHVGLSWKAGVMTAYYDGAAVGSASFAQIGTGWTTSEIGQQGGGGKNFPGFIDDVRAYARSVTASEAAALFAAGREDLSLVAR